DGAALPGCGRTARRWTCFAGRLIAKRQREQARRAKALRRIRRKNRAALCTDPVDRHRCAPLPRRKSEHRSSRAARAPLQLLSEATDEKGDVLGLLFGLRSQDAEQRTDLVVNVRRAFDRLGDPRPEDLAILLAQPLRSLLDRGLRHSKT